MKIYARKIDNQFIDKQVSYTKEILKDFLDNKNDHDTIICEGKTSHKTATVALLLATDPRFDNNIKQVLKAEGNYQIGDIMLMYKFKTKYIIELVKAGTDKAEHLGAIFADGDRHLLLEKDGDTDLDIKELIKEKYNAHTDFNIDNENEKYSRFKSLYGKDIISSLNGKELLYRLFAKKEMDENSLIYNIEHNNYYREFGGIGGGTAFKYPLFFIQKRIIGLEEQ